MAIHIKKDQIEASLHQEWIVTNGLGGYASGSISGVPRRKYHSLLNAALPAPFGRMIMLNYVEDAIVVNEKKHALSSVQHSPNENPPYQHLIEFKMENGIPFWRYQIGDVVIEKSLFLIHRQNTVCISYKVLEAPHNIILQWRPYLHFRLHEEPVDQSRLDETPLVQVKEFDYEIRCVDLPILRLFNSSHPLFSFDSTVLNDIFYEIEAVRGYTSLGKLKSPGYFSIELKQRERTSFMVSTESWDILKTLTASEAWNIEKVRKKNLYKMAGSPKDPIISELTHAADQFLITPVTRFKDMVRLQAAGEEFKSIIAGYPWFTEWGRDTMISLEGLTLATGRFRDAFSILHTFSNYLKGGLIPNMFPEGENQGIYNTADATLWFFHAINAYVETTHDEDIIEFLMPRLHEIINSHTKGTHYGIFVDHDGLLHQGQEGFALTWMDAKMNDWVVTPRRGKAVEINALWYNALKLYENWSGKTQDLATKCYESFNQKFWFDKGGYLYDLIDEKGGDEALRPNQIFSISLKYPILQEDRWKSVLETVKRELLTPVGLRTLSQSHPDYKPVYKGDLRERDSSYHQGTIWPWLLGHYFDAWVKTYPEDVETPQTLFNGLKEHLNKECIGTIAEIFDASYPHHARGCFAQAWSVSEFLRCMVKLKKMRNL